MRRREPGGRRDQESAMTKTLSLRRDRGIYALDSIRK
jgi:hypothetical protein